MATNKTSPKPTAPRKTRVAPTAATDDTAQDYPALLAEVKARVQSAQYAALRAVNKELVGLYWDIGRLIVERQQDAKHGAAIAERLADDLRVAFPGVGGFSRRNVFYMREFFLLYREDAKVQPLVAQVGWSHNLVILQRCKDALEREFYLRMTRKFGWSKAVLIHQVDNQSYEKSLLGQTNFHKTVAPALRAQAQLAVKDEYAFDFLELGEQELHIQRLICKHRPEQLKLTFALWSRAAVLLLVKQEFGIELPIRTMGEYLKRWGFTPQKPITRAYEQRPEAVKAWLDEQYPAIAERVKSEDAEIHWGDETAVVNTDVRGRGYGLVPRG